MDALLKTLLKIKKKSNQRRFLKSRGFSEPEMKEILSQVKFLQKGLKKFPRAGKMRYNESSIAQASSFKLAKYRTWKAYSSLGKIKHSIDLCGGMGGDAIAAGLRWKVTVIERDQDIFDMLEHNLLVYGVKPNITCILGDINHLLVQSEFQERIRNADYVFFDPSRRDQSKRTVKIEEYSPPLSIIEEVLKWNKNICVKISPGVDILHIPYNCDIEVVSLKGEVKEVILWFGRFKLDKKITQIIATKLPEKLSMSKILTKYNETIPELASSLGIYLYEPDPAAIKAHLINELAIHFDLHTIHNKVAYLTGEKYVSTPWLKTYQILDHCPIDVAQIKQLLKKHEIDKVDCKARGLTLDLHKIQKQLNSKGKNIGLVIFTWVNNQKTAIIAQYLWDFSR